MCDAWDHTPSDTNPPEDVREAFARMVEARNRWNASRDNVVQFRPRQQAEQQLRYDLAAAFRSMELAPRDEGDA